RRQHEAGPQTLYVPLPWTRERLVEVVNVENQHSFGRGEAAKVRQVTIAACLNGDPRHRGICEVPRLNDGCAAEEFERRLSHPLILNRNQTRNSIGVRFLEQFDRVPRLGSRLPLGLRSARALLAKRFSLLASFNLGRSDCRYHSDSPLFERQLEHRSLPS